ncbi:oligosaccharide flippase family protein [Patescibacteria group bacterium]|nr:oligosaccharide flippase family protein [Patescibacteria group bacterium]
MVKIIKEKINNLWKLKFVKDVFTLQIGSFVGTGLALVASVIYARVLGSELYGNYALIFAFAGLVGIFMDWGVGYATLTLLSESYARGDRNEMKNILTYFLKSNLYIAIVIGILAIIFSPQLSGLIYHRPEIGSFARLVIFATILRTFLSLLMIMLQVLRKIKYLTIIENVNKFFLHGAPITFVLLGFGLWGIVWGHFLTAFGFMFCSLWIYYHFATRNSLVSSLPEIIRNFPNVKISKYFKFGFSIAVDKNIANSFSLLPVIFLGALSSPEQVANLKIAIAYLALPKVFLGPIARLLQIQLPKAKAASANDLKSNYYKSALYTGLTFIVLTILFLMIAPILIKVFYGQQFILSIKLVYVLSLGTIFAGFAVGYSSLYRTMNKMKTVITINITNLITGLLLFVISLQYTTALKSTVVLIVYWSLFSLIVNFVALRKKLNKLEH